MCYLGNRKAECDSVFLSYGEKGRTEEPFLFVLAAGTGCSARLDMLAFIEVNKFDLLILPQGKPDLAVLSHYKI